MSFFFVHPSISDATNYPRDSSVAGTNAKSAGGHEEDGIVRSSMEGDTLVTSADETAGTTGRGSIREEEPGKANSNRPSAEAEFQRRRDFRAAKGDSQSRAGLAVVHEETRKESDRTKSPTGHEASGSPSKR
jgi:hypothetical protein